MPYPNEHACRIRDPNDFQPKSFRRITQGKLVIIIGRLKGKTTTTTQAYRYPISKWRRDEAAAHCKKEGGRFEPAKPKESLFRRLFSRSPDNGEKEEKEKMNEQAKKILESLVPYKVSALLAVPGISKNGRNWPKEELEKAATLYPSKVVMTDHSSDTLNLVGITTGARYGEGPKGEGLYAEAVGLMDRDLFDKIKGLPEKDIPPLLKGVSMGGFGDIKRGDDGKPPDVVNFEPLEWSFTPFPGIPDAQVLEIMEIKESLQKRKEEATLPPPVPTPPAESVSAKVEIIEAQPQLQQGSDQATIEANVKKLDEAQKAQPPVPEPPAVIEQKPTEPPKPTIEDQLKEALAKIDTLSKDIEELKAAKAPSKGKGIAVAELPIEQRPTFETQRDLVKRVRELIEQSKAEGTPISTRNAWKKAAHEKVRQLEAERRAWQQVCAEFLAFVEEQ